MAGNALIADGNWSLESIGATSAKRLAARIKSGGLSKNTETGV